LIPKADASIILCSCTSSTGYYLSAKICTNHHQTRISCNIHITYKRQTGENKSFCRKSGQICGIKSSHTCLEMYDQTNVGLLCCVSYGSSVAVPSNTPHSVKLLWTCDWPVRETATWQHNSDRNIHAPGGIQTRNHSKRAAADPRLRPCGHWDWPFFPLVDTKYISGLNFTAPLCDSLECLFVSCVQKCGLHKSRGPPVIRIL